jgi:signal transduction histidine kinase
MEQLCSWQRRVERSIALMRLGVASVSLLAIWLDAPGPSRYAHTASIVLAGYVAYALLMALLVWRSPTSLVRLRLLTHAFDLAIFPLFIHFTEGPTSPCFMYFVFALISATLRWQWYGALSTALVALGTFIGMGVYAADILHKPAFELNAFIIRSVYLAVVATLLGCVGVHEQRRRRHLSMLAAWPRTLPPDLRALVSEVLGHVAVILNAPRLLMAWEDREESRLHLASWASDKFSLTPESADAFRPLVIEALDGKSFLCPDVRASTPIVLYTSPTGVRRWHGMPLHPQLQARFDTAAVLALRLRGQSLQGYLLALGKSRMTIDDLILGEVVARHVAAHMDQFYLSRQRHRAAIAQERFRLARDLHDGLLQSLSCANFRLESIHHLPRGESLKVYEHVREIQHLLTAVQGDLRMFIEDLRPSSLRRPEEACNLADRVDELCVRIEHHWGLRVELRQDQGLDELPQDLEHEIYYVIHEALINAARHAEASTVQVELSRQHDRLRIVVADNGRGFPFRGHYDLAALIVAQQGPRTLKERIASLGGGLVVDSTASGARLEMALPLAPAGDGDAYSTGGR